MFKKIILKLIKLYQKTFSFDHGVWRGRYPGGFCRYYPTCSQYGYQAIDKYGVAKGGWLAIGRIFRCNPWAKGGMDPVR